jgi:hypothetical protein
MSRVEFRCAHLKIKTVAGCVTVPTATVSDGLQSVLHSIMPFPITVLEVPSYLVILQN